MKTRKEDWSLSNTGDIKWYELYFRYLLVRVSRIKERTGVATHSHPIISKELSDSLASSIEREIRKNIEEGVVSMPQRLVDEMLSDLHVMSDHVNIHSPAMARSPIIRNGRRSILFREDGDVPLRPGDDIFLSGLYDGKLAKKERVGQKHTDARCVAPVEIICGDDYEEEEGKVCVVVEKRGYTSATTRAMMSTGSW